MRRKLEVALYISFGALLGLGIASYRSGSNSRRRKSYFCLG